jgi:hypothetical protein
MTAGAAHAREIADRLGVAVLSLPKRETSWMSYWLISALRRVAPEIDFPIPFMWADRSYVRCCQVTH